MLAPPTEAPVLPGSEENAEAKDDSCTGSAGHQIASDQPKHFNSALELTKALRSLGLSKAAAKAVTNGGWPALQRLTEGAHPEPDTGELANSLKAAIAALEIKK